MNQQIPVTGIALALAALAIIYYAVHRRKFMKVEAELNAQFSGRRCRLSRGISDEEPVGTVMIEGVGDIPAKNLGAGSIDAGAEVEIIGIRFEGTLTSLCVIVKPTGA